jgi:glutathione S-transferase
LQWFFWSLTTLEGAAFGYTNDPVEATRAHLERFLAPLDKLLASTDHLVGNSFTAADIVCVYDLGLLFGAYELKTHPSVFSYLTRTLKRPAAAGFADAIDWPGNMEN